MKEKTDLNKKWQSLGRFLKTIAIAYTKKELFVERILT